MWWKAEPIFRIQVVASLDGDKAGGIGGISKELQRKVIGTLQSICSQN